MKKILISILIVLLIVLAYTVMFNGLDFLNFKILSVGQIEQENDKLTNDINQVNTLLKKDYPAKKEELSTSVTELLAKKEEYFNIAKISTEGEITKANTEETYLIEYLWTRVGRHATSKGVNIKMDVNSSDIGEPNIKNLGFTVNGQYIAIIQFVSELENDDKLNFKIENFKMIKEVDDAKKTLTATFNVRGIRIKAETVSSSATQNDTVTEQDNTQENVENDTNIVENMVDTTQNTIENIQ